MTNRKISYFILFFLFLLALISGGMILSLRSQELKVIFLNVGQGDAILISQGGNQILIDSGKSGQIILEKLGSHIPFWDRKIEAVLMTHPDQDHIGGFADVFRNYEIETVLKTNVKNDTKTFEVLGEYIVLEKSEIIEAKSGTNIQFPSGAKIEIIYPQSSVSENSDDMNASSVVSVLSSGQDKFLLTGDLPTTDEKKLMESGADLQANFLKVAHHGSKYSTSNSFIETVMPTDAIISVGKKNSYGHPNPEVLQRLLENKVNVLRTDESGDIIYVCENLKTKCQMIGN